MIRIGRVVFGVLAALCAVSSALATDFPRPAYEWRLENASPDVRALQAAVAPWWPEDFEQGTHDDHGRANRWDSVFWQGHSPQVYCLTRRHYGVEDSPQVEAARSVAEALLDSLGIDYIREPALAKTAQAYETDSWLGMQSLVDVNGALLWLCDQLTREPLPIRDVPQLAQYAEMRDKVLEKEYTSPEDVILRYPVALGGLPLAEETAKEPQNGIWQLIFVVVTPEGKVINLSLQNAGFRVKRQTEISTPVTLEEAERIALEKYPYWMRAFHESNQDLAAYQESLRAISPYERIGLQPRLERAEPVYMRVGADQAVPAWSLAFRYDFVLDGEVVPMEEHARYRRLFVSAVDGTLLMP